MKFYICDTCGNIIAYVENKNVPVVCCGKKMQEISVGVVEASYEKHIPVVYIDGNKVSVVVGSVEHPMVIGHHIAWVALETKEGNQRKILDKTGQPKVEFMITDTDEVIAVYAYCNLHGLWKN